MQLNALNSQLLLSMPSGGEWLWIVLAVVVLFGGKKIPELAKGLGKGIREFNDAKTGIKNELESGMKEQKEPNK
ncbi:MAG TPA: twin-arginine translocase TatA/TatE family subunit [Flavipsychrobacter sp.]|jgi:sec-independent protein translocase protein TatA|nr:twin-arginine translocase TatA/TatE family subunit [Flavipsychrobacter sp.]